MIHKKHINFNNNDVKVQKYCNKIFTIFHYFNILPQHLTFKMIRFIVFGF